jgi:hypothetical protein
MAAHVYAAHQAEVLRLAELDGGVSRPIIIDKLGVSAPTATKLIERAGLEPGKKEGRVQFFSPPNGTTPEPADDDVVEPETATESEPEKAELPPEVKAAAVVTSPEVVEGTDDDDDEIARLDAELLDTRNALRDAATKAGKALGEWLTHQAIVDAMRARMTTLVEQRLEACS